MQTRDDIAIAFQYRGGVERDSSGKRAGKGLLVKVEHYPCLCAAQDVTLLIRRRDGEDKDH